MAGSPAPAPGGDRVKPGEKSPSPRIPERKARTAAVLVSLLLSVAILFQVAVDRTPAGSGERAGNFPSAASLARFLGGIRQYLAYTFFIKTDKLHHVYGDTPELIPYFLIITYLDPQYIDAYYVACGLIFDAGKPDEALKLNMRGIEINPNSADLYFSLADIYIRKNQYQEALNALEEASRLKSELSTRDLIVEGLSIVYKKLGEEEKSRKVYSQSILANRIRLLNTDLDPNVRISVVERVNEYCDRLMAEGIENQ